jgi:hypothetical protein
MTQKDYSELAPTASSQAREDWQKEHAAGGFTCVHCNNFVPIDARMGTLNRNHCNTCLWSRHVDDEKGDRMAACEGQMAPVGLTFKHEGIGKIGELMLIHQCQICGKISINRIARDDPENTLMRVYEDSLDMEQGLETVLSDNGIRRLSQSDAKEVRIQLFGNV